MKKRGFTLIELVVVMAIIAVLALLVVGAIIAARAAQVRTQHRSNGKTMQTAIEANFKNGEYTPTSALGERTFEQEKGTYDATLGTVTCDNGGGTLTVTEGSYVINVADDDCSVETPIDQYCGPGACPS